jgi:GTP cyclohydrolase I
VGLSRISKGIHKREKQRMSMKETMDQELAEAIRTLEKANGALARIFNMEEGESDE